MIKAKAKKGPYQIKLNGVLIDVFPYIFPPSSPFSESTHTVYDELGHLKGKNVLDIGTGTGIQAIQAVLAGAEKVDAVDIYEGAVECARHNFKLNCLEKKIKVWKSDLFSNVPRKQYDLIIANLPIVDIEEEDLRLHSLFDPGFKYHERLFQEAPAYLAKDGSIILCHADLQSRGFERLETLATNHGYTFKVKQAIKSLGYEWRNYEFKLVGDKK